MTAGPPWLQEALAERYLIERELGRGGMAVVYLARDPKHDRRVALKLLLPEIAGVLGAERFLREVQIAARLHHSHILGLIDSGVVPSPQGPLPYFVMPYVEGESLRDLLHREPQLAVPVAVRIAGEVADALDYAHRHGVVHRDIKPENIMLEDGHAMVADFGVAKAIDAGQGGGQMTMTGLAIGTPSYMSPEQALADPRIDGRSDIYALGALLHEMLTGEAPFSAPTPQAVIAKQMAGARAPITLVRPQVPAELEAIAARALAVSPADRFATAGEMRDALANVGLTIRTPVPTDAQPAATARRASRRIWIVATLAAAAMVALIALRALRPAPSAALDANLVAVAPFDVLDPKLALWKEGLVDVLARNLDGAGPLRTVPPTVVIKRWSGRADAASAQGLGRSTGAQLVVYGSLVPTGGDSVRMTASVLDAATGKSLGDIERRGHVDRMDQLADSVSVGLLNELSRSRPIGAFRRVGIGAASFPALRAFLQGEQFFRQASWDSSLAYYQRAIALDSNFSLALRRASNTIGWSKSPWDSLGTTYSLRAGAHNHGLGPRDSLLTVIDSVMTSLYADEDSTSWSRQRRLFSILESATRQYPEDPEVWYYLGDVRWHFGKGPGLDVTQQQILDAFDHSIALDSSFAPSFEHAVQLALDLRGPQEALRYARAMARAQAGGGRTDEVALIIAALEAGGLPSATVDSLIASGSAVALSGAHLTFAGWADSAGIAVKVSQSAIRGRRGQYLYGFDSLRTDRTWRRALAFRGHFHQSCDGLGATEPRSTEVLSTCLAFGAVDSSAANAMVSGWVSQLESGAPSGWAARRAFPWLVARRDTITLARMAQGFAKRIATDSSSGGRQFARYMAQSAEAYRALARRDTTDALRRFEALPDSLAPYEDIDQLTLAGLLIARGDNAQALQILRHRTFLRWGFAPGVLWELYRGRAAEAVGEKAEAVHSYRFVVDAWASGDPEVQPYVEEARAGLARLSKEVAQ